MEKHSPEKIIEILRSIEKVSLDASGQLDTLFIDSTSGPEGIRGFIPGSFTRELLELIEWHLQDHDIGQPLTDNEKECAKTNLNNLTSR